VELSNHEHALCALRQLNANPDVFGKDRRPIVEFAIDNKEIINRRQHQIQKLKVKAMEQGKGTSSCYMCTRGLRTSCSHYGSRVWIWKEEEKGEERTSQRETEVRSGVRTGREEKESGSGVNATKRIKERNSK